LDTFIRFLVLEVKNKHKLVCEIAEKYYYAGKKVLVQVKDADEGEELDRLLWIWKQASFVPHVYTQRLTYKILEPVVLTSQIENNPGFDILLLVHPAPLETLLKFEQVIDFAEKYDPHLLNSSRARFKSYRENKIKVKTCQPGEFLAENLT
jgi:DNA polymerase-3 subunit chi